MKIYSKLVIDIATNEVIESESFEYSGKLARCWGAALAAAPSALGSAGGMLGTVGSALGTGMQMAGAANDLFGPKGALVTGDISKGASAAQGLYSGGKGMFGDSDMKPEKFGPPTTSTTMGLSADEFNQIPPEVRQELIRKLAGR